jgi:hypothetical protein
LRRRARHARLVSAAVMSAGLVALWTGLATVLLTTPAHAQAHAAASKPAALYRYPGADLALGDKLVREHACTACHVRKVGGDGSAMYRPQGRINTPSALATMVEMCNTELNLGLFPEDVLAVAAVLQRDHYRFVAGSAASSATSSDAKP